MREEEVSERSMLPTEAAPALAGADTWPCSASPDRSGRWPGPECGCWSVACSDTRPGGSSQTLREGRSASDRMSFEELPAITGLLGLSRAGPCYSSRCLFRGLLPKAAPRWVLACPPSSGVGGGWAFVLVEKPKFLLGVVTVTPPVSEIAPCLGQGSMLSRASTSTPAAW